MLGALVGLVVRQFRSRTSLIAENELLRQQLAAAKSQLQRKRVMFISTISSCLAKAIFCASSRSTPASTTSLGHTRASGREQPLPRMPEANGRVVALPGPLDGSQRQRGRCRAFV